MSSLQGACVVAWLERWGARYLRDRQPSIYQQLLLHVGGTDFLRRYSGLPAYWQCVQTLLDCFFSGTERAKMCAELIEEPLFRDDPDFRPFLIQAKAEIRCRELILLAKAPTDESTFIRSVN